MLVSAPLVEAEQDRAIRIENLTKVGMVRPSLALAEERLVPFEALRHVPHADDRPRAFHDISPTGLTTDLPSFAARRRPLRRRAGTRRGPPERPPKSGRRRSGRKSAGSSERSGPVRPARPRRR